MRGLEYRQDVAHCVYTFLTLVLKMNYASGIPLLPNRDLYEKEQRRSLRRAITAMALSARDMGDPAEILQRVLGA